MRKHLLLLIILSLLLVSFNYQTTVAYDETLIGEITFVRPLEQENYYIPEIALPRDLQKYLYNICNEYEVNYIKALAIMTVENPNFDPLIISKTNDYGLFQINIYNHDSLREILKIKDFLDPYENIKAGVYILSKLQTLDTQLRYMAYNQGVYSMRKTVSRGYYSTNYSRKVYNEMLRIKKLLEGEKW